jgi:hypothetical protein
LWLELEPNGVLHMGTAAEPFFLRV